MEEIFEELEQEGVFNITQVTEIKDRYDNSLDKQSYPQLEYLNHEPFNKLQIMSFSSEDNKFWEPKVYINNVQINCLVDNGASCSVISLQCLNGKAFNNIQITKHTTDKELCMADQTTQKCVGKTTINIILNYKTTIK